MGRHKQDLIQQLNNGLTPVQNLKVGKYSYHRDRSYNLEFVGDYNDITVSGSVITVKTSVWNRREKRMEMKWVDELKVIAKNEEECYKFANYYKLGLLDYCFDYYSIGYLDEDQEYVEVWY